MEAGKVADLLESAINDMTGAAKALLNLGAPGNLAERLELIESVAKMRTLVVELRAEAAMDAVGDYRNMDCPRCGRHRVLQDGTCEKCRWNVDAGQYASAHLGHAAVEGAPKVTPYAGGPWTCPHGKRHPEGEACFCGLDAAEAKMARSPGICAAPGCAAGAASPGRIFCEPHGRSDLTGRSA